MKVQLFLVAVLEVNKVQKSCIKTWIRCPNPNTLNKKNHEIKETDITKRNRFKSKKSDFLIF